MVDGLQLQPQNRQLETGRRPQQGKMVGDTLRLAQPICAILASSGLRMISLIHLVDSDWSVKVP
jgi:hypothetical protein